MLNDEGVAAGVEVPHLAVVDSAGEPRLHARQPLGDRRLAATHAVAGRRSVTALHADQVITNGHAAADVVFFVLAADEGDGAAANSREPVVAVGDAVRGAGGEVEGADVVAEHIGGVVADPIHVLVGAGLAEGEGDVDELDGGVADEGPGSGGGDVARDVEAIEVAAGAHAEGVGDVDIAAPASAAW